MATSQLEILPKIEKSRDNKKGRILTAIFLGLTIIPSFVFWSISQLKEKKINLFSSSIKVELPQMGASSDKTSNLSTKLNRWATNDLNGLPGTWAVKIDFLDDDFSWGINQNQQMIAASLIKLPIVAAFYHQVETGKLTLDQIYQLKEGDKVAGAGSLQSQPAGKELTLAKIASLALSQSDNTAAKILTNLVGVEVIDELISKWEMTETDLSNNLTSADDISLFFKKLYQGEIIKDEFKEKMLTDLTKTNFEDRIPAGLPQGIRVAHKIGTEVGVVSDAGIVFVPDKPFILVILSQKTIAAMAKEKFPQLVNDIYWLVIED